MLPARWWESFGDWSTEFVTQVSSWLHDLNPGLDKMPIPTDLSSGTGYHASWLVPRDVHAAELVYITVPVAILMTTLLFVPWKVQLPARWREVPSMGTTERLFSVLDRLLCVAVSICFGMTVIYKFQKGIPLSLLQPCHLEAVFLIYMFIDRGSRLGRFAHNYLATAVWGAMGTLVTPDTRFSDMALEVEHFFVNHALMAAVPFYNLFRRKYDLYSGWPASLCIALCVHLQHFAFYEFFSIWGGININYVMHPPVPLVSFGADYRITAMLAILFISTVNRLVIVDGFLWLAGRVMPQRSIREAPGNQSVPTGRWLRRGYWCDWCGMVNDPLRHRAERLVEDDVDEDAWMEGVVEDWLREHGRERVPGEEQDAEPDGASHSLRRHLKNANGSNFRSSQTLRNRKRK